MLILSILLSGCVMSLTCISHIDRDRNGECDNCGIAMEVPREDIEKIEVTTLPTKTYYGRNETLDVTGGKITVTYNDGKPDEEIDMTAEGRHHRRARHGVSTAKRACRSNTAATAPPSSSKSAPHATPSPSTSGMKAARWNRSSSRRTP